MSVLFDEQTGGYYRWDEHSGQFVLIHAVPPPLASAAPATGRRHPSALMIIGIAGALWAAVMTFGVYPAAMNSVESGRGANSTAALPDLPSDRSVRIARSRDGHHYVLALVAGKSMRFLVDTGATRVSLSYAAARRAGINLNQLSYSQVVMTANGDATRAPIWLRSLDIDGIVVHDVEAYVGHPGAADFNLLGMSFLGRLSSFEFRGGDLILTP